MVFDRGSIKWASLMLPEHVKALREWMGDEKHPKARAPLFDEQTNEIFDRVLQQALETTHPLSISFIEGGQEHTTKGVITKLDHINETITVREQTGVTYIISVQQIIQMA